MRDIQTNVAEFMRFYSLLMSSAPSGYIPFLFPLEMKNKDPLSSRGSWAREENRLTPDDARRFLIHGYNVGISARDYDQLVLIDIDDMNAIPESSIKPTLSVITRSRIGTHNYYFTEDIKCKVNIPTDHGEIRSCNQYLVCPGSYVPTDPTKVPPEQIQLCGYYSIHNPIAPTSITFDEFPKVFRDHHDRMAQEISPPRRAPTGRKSKSALFDLTIVDVVHYPKNKARFASVFHGSESGANTAVSGNLLHCWRHLVSHTPLQALSVMAGLYTCQQAGESHRNGGSGHSVVDIGDGETLFKIWDYARRNGYIPADDIPPSTSLRWFVLATEVCKESDIVDGWKLPKWAYCEGRRLLKTNI